MKILPSKRKFLFCLCVSALGACSENGGVMATNPPPAAPMTAAGKPATGTAGMTASPSTTAGTGMTTNPTMSTGAAGSTSPAGGAGMIASAAGMTTSAAGGGATAGSMAAAGGSTAAMGGAGGAMSAGMPTFTRVFEEVFVPVGCGAAGACHRGPGGGKLDLTDKATSYKSLVGVMGMGMSPPTPPTKNCSESGLMRVKAGDPASSLLVDKLENAMPKCGQPMPPGGPVDSDQLKLVKDWIMAGAKDD